MFNSPSEELKQLLGKPLIPQGLSLKFPTRGNGLLTGLTKGQRPWSDIVIEEERARTTK